MVGIVIVSHSAGVAEGIREMALQMVDNVPIAAAGGIDDPVNPFGTDVLRVHQAINEVYGDDGVLVLMDLGSALLSAEMALELLLPGQRAAVQLCAAPLLEGVIAAAVQASGGGSLEVVYAEAMAALAAKQQQMPGARAVSTAASGAGEKRELLIANRLGLHARPAARFVTTASRFRADIRVHKVGQDKFIANAKSINQVATLGARQGDHVVVRAAGPDGLAALAALAELVQSGFGEGEAEIEAGSGPPTVGSIAEDGLEGIGASPGIAVGPAMTYRPRMPQVQARTVAAPGAEWVRLQGALAAARGELEQLRSQTASQAGPAAGAIFEAHILFLQDPVLLDRVRATIYEQSRNAEAAWQAAIDENAARFRALDDDYMRARATDVLDVGRRVLSHLTDIADILPRFREPAILVAGDLTPSDAAQLDPDWVLGICTERGGATAHGAIVARAFGIPAVVGVGPALQRVDSGQIIGLNGSTGEVWLRPDGKRLRKLRQQQAAWQERQAAARVAGQQPAQTRDGQAVPVVANISSARDVPPALAYGAEGVGLFRTEFLFLNRRVAPTEEEQYQVYRAAANDLGERPLVIRTLDVGGDKPLPYAAQGHEDNPFLGWRGIRFCLDHPRLFLPQLRAILRAAHERNVLLMLPMVSHVEEVRATRRLLEQAAAELSEQGFSFATAMPLGIMIEIPAAVSLAGRLADEVAFFSIGTNDLTQYVMAADRTNARVARLANALHPAVLHQIAETVRAAHRAGIPVGVCGELAADPLAAPLLLGLGVDELSMSGPAIPAVKQAVARVTLDEARSLADRILEMDTAEAIERYLQQQARTGPA